MLKAAKKKQFQGKGKVKGSKVVTSSKLHDFIRQQVRTLRSRYPEGEPRRDVKDRLLDSKAERKRKQAIPEDEQPGLAADDGALQMGRLLTNPMQVYRFRLAVSFSINSNGSGVISGNWTWDPSAFTEWSYLSSLFNQFRIVETRLRIYSWEPSDEEATRKQGPFAIACDAGLNGSTPASVASVVDCPNSLFHNTAALVPTELTQKVTEMSFASTSSTTPGPYAGAYGQWEWYGSGFTASLTYCQALFEGMYEFRSRT